MILKNLLKVSVFFYSTLLFSQNILGIKEEVQFKGLEKQMNKHF